MRDVARRSLRSNLALPFLERLEILQTSDKHFVFGCVGICRARHTGQGTLRLKCDTRL